MEVVFIRNLKRYFALSLMLMILVLGMGSVQVSARTVNAVTEAKTVKGGKWINSAKGKKFRYADGTYAKSIWLKRNGAIYRIKKNGVRATGWFKVGGKQFYASKTGKVYIKRWLDKNGSRYYFQNGGICASQKWVQINGTQYYFLKSGKLAVNRIIRNGDTYYYVNENGERLKSSWAQWKGKSYYLDINGVALKETWLLYGGKFYYFGADGTMAVNQWIQSTYYVGEDGARMTNCSIDGFYLDATGKKTGYAEQFIFVGDSRMVGMQASVLDQNIRYIAKIGEGYDWLAAEAGPKLREYLELRSDVTVVLALGVNDMGTGGDNLGNANQYIAYYQQLMLDFPTARFYILSVNPIDDELAKKHGFQVKDAAVTAFNQKLQSVFLGTQFIDSYTYLKEQPDFATFDGVHYTQETYRMLYQFLMEKIRRPDAVI